MNRIHRDLQREMFIEHNLEFLRGTFATQRSPYFSFWQGLPFLKKTNKTSTTRFLGSHRRALALDNIAINKQKTFSLVFSNYYLIFFSLRGPFWKSPSDGDGDGSGNGAIRGSWSNIINGKWSDRLTIFGISNCPRPPRILRSRGLFLVVTFRARKADLCLPCLHYSRSKFQ